MRIFIHSKPLKIAPRPHLPYETIKRYENGKSNATSENLQKIANALGVEI